MAALGGGKQSNNNNGGSRRIEYKEITQKRLETAKRRDMGGKE